MSQSRMLIVDDELSIRNLLRATLENQGFTVATAASGKEGLGLAAEFHPHLIILDLGLPDLDGLEVLKRFRQWTTIPIIVLTVNDEEAAKVSVLDAGADDYLTKPFSVPELLARVRVGLRHHGSAEATPVFRSGALVVDVNEKTVARDGVAIKLTSTEYQLLTLLVRANGRVVAQKQLLLSVWGEHAADQSHYLRIYIAQLRKKIENSPSTPQHILTEPGVGYRLV